EEGVGGGPGRPVRLKGAESSCWICILLALRDHHGWLRARRRPPLDDRDRERLLPHRGHPPWHAGVLGDGNLRRQAKRRSERDDGDPRLERGASLHADGFETLHFVPPIGTRAEPTAGPN